MRGVIFVSLVILLTACVPPSVPDTEIPTVPLIELKLPPKWTDTPEVATISPETPASQSDSTSTMTTNPSAEATRDACYVPDYTENESYIYLDFKPAFDLRAGPGCGYPLSSAVVAKKDPLVWYRILAKSGKWAQVDLCNGQTAWFYPPAVNGANMHYLPDMLPDLRDDVTAIPSASSMEEHDKMLEGAEKSLRKYLKYLSEGKYAEAVPLYGAGFGTLITWNKDTIAPTDYPALLKQGCETNGYICKMSIESIPVRTFTNEMEMSFLATVSWEDFYDPSINGEKTLTFHVIRDCDGDYFIIDTLPQDF